MEPYNSDTNWYEIDRDHTSRTIDKEDTTQYPIFGIVFKSIIDRERWKNRILETYKLKYLGEKVIAGGREVIEYFYNETINTIYEIHLSTSKKYDNEYFHGFFCDKTTNTFALRKKYNLPPATCKMEQA